MLLTVSERLSLGRRQQFVGREAQRLLFAEAIAAPVLPFILLHVYGAGGVGKTALLGELAAQCREAGISTAHLDARDFRPTPDAFLNALRLALNLPETADPAAHLAAQSGRRVIFLDTYEEIQALDGWLRDAFCPLLPADCLLVVAGRYPPTTGWTSDLGWQTLLRALPLRNLSAEEGRLYLDRRAVPAASHQSVLDFTRGHPLALSLVADSCQQRSDFAFAPDAHPDIIQTLLRRFLQSSILDDQRAALEIAALMRVTTEPLLAEMLPKAADARALFDWLRTLAFVETGRFGLFPHDLARDVLSADLRWRNPERFAEWNRKARRYYDQRLRQAGGLEQQNILAGYLYLFHDDPIVKPFFDWNDIGGCYTDAPRPSDLPALRRMTEKHEGAESAELAAYWLNHPAQRTCVVRDSRHGGATDGDPIGFLTGIALHEIGEAERARDPITAAAWNHLAQTAPLRAGESAFLFRFWMAEETYQSVSEAQGLLILNVIRLQLTTPGLAYAVLLCVSPDFWQPIAHFTEMPRLPADFEINGRPYGFYEHDWRIEPPAAWLDMLAEKTEGLRPYLDAPPAAPALAVLTRDEFSDAVTDALRGYARPDGLRDNPLLRARCVVAESGSRAGERERCEALRLLIREAVEELQAAPRLARQHRALFRTYLNPVGSQAEAADFLDLPFSTYRRHLAEGIASVVAALWKQEIMGEK